MSKTLQNQIKALHDEELNEVNVPYFCRKISSISEENLEDLPYESIYSLLEVSYRTIQYFKNSPIHDFYTNKQTLKALSEDISQYHYLINFHHSVPYSNELNLDCFSYHELENLAKDQQHEISLFLQKISQSKSENTNESLFTNLEILMGKPKTKALLFDYSLGIPAYFEHTDLTIEKSKEKLNKEVDNYLAEFTEKYGNNAIQKIVENRRKWDHDYFCAYEKVEKEVSETEKYDDDVMSQDTIVKSPKQVKTEKNPRFLLNPAKYCVFVEGRTVNELELSIVKMDNCLEKCTKTNLKLSDDEIEIVDEINFAY